MVNLLLLSLCCVLLASMPARAADRLTYAYLTHRLTSLEDLALLPEPGCKTALASSYDRASQYDEATGKYVRWDANGDGSGIIRKEGDEEVLAEMNGPGCIWRIWSASAGDGHVKIYLDGAAEPAVDLPFKDYFSGKESPFNYPSLVYQTAANGLNSYIPIPYQKSCKIVADKGWGNYYQFTYTTFPAGTQTPTFTRDLDEPGKAALAAADKLLHDSLGSDPAGDRAGAKTLSDSFTSTGGKAQTWTIRGPRAITAIRVHIDQAAMKDPVTTMRDLVLRMWWDGEKSPSVAVPLGDFFGSAPGINNYQSLPLGMTPDGLYCFWYMPFARTARIQIANDGATAVPIKISITHAPLDRPIAEMGRFHCKWHRDAFLPDPATGRGIDWTMLKTEGVGRFCGVMLHVWNPTGGWWGEGDDKFFVDGEKFPSSFGTGSEDYFGYAWSSDRLFDRPFHGQTVNQHNRGHISDYRWHIADNVPFQKSFDGCIEKYFGPKTRYACTAYWYLSPNGTDPYVLPPASERSGYFDEPARVPGVIEGEDIQVLSKTAGNAGEQGMGGFGNQWSGDAQLWWNGAAPGDKLTLAVPVKTAGSYEIKAQLTKAIDYGIVQLYMDDTKLGGPIDCYADNVVASGVLSLGKLDLTAGQHRLIVEITGADDRAKTSYMFGLDYLKLELAK